MKCHMALCRRETDRTLYLVGIPGAWPTCDRHGKKTIKALMSLHPRHGVYSKKNTK